MNTYRGRRRLLALAIGCLATAPVLAGIEAPARAATTTVIEQGTQYIPKQVDVAPGDSVVWTFQSAPSGSPGHTVTFDDGTDLNRNCPGNLVFNDCQDTPGETVQRRFTTPGTYPYSCRIHRGDGMVGVVVVSAGGTTSSTVPGGSTSTATVKSSTTTTTKAASTSSTTGTTRVLATSSTMVKSTTTTSDSSSVLLPGEPPPFSSDDTSSAAGKSGDSNGGSDSGTVALIVGLLLAASAGGGYLLWRLRPGRT